MVGFAGVQKAEMDFCGRKGACVNSQVQATAAALLSALCNYLNKGLWIQCLIKP